MARVGGYVMFGHVVRYRFFIDVPMAKNLLMSAIRGWLRLALDVVILAGLFTALFKEKTEGENRWRWGKE